MKLKLRIKKDLKRDLKKIAAKRDMERKDLAIQLISEFVSSNDEITTSEIEEFMESTKSLEEGITEINSNEALSNEEKKALIKELKEKHRVVIYTSKMPKKKTETLIINLDELSYYGLLLIAENSKMTIEHLGVDVVTDYVKANLA
jgi:predicted transcriptional regulator